MMILLAAIGGALTNRLRGGWLQVGMIAGRSGWAVVLALLAWKHGMAPLPAALLGAAAWLGCAWGQFGGLAMGMRGPRPRVSPWVTMGAWGLARVAGPVAVLAWTGGTWWPILLAGLACPAIYRAVWCVPTRILPRGFGYGDGPDAGGDPPELAEAIHGAAIAVALVLR